MPVPWFADWYSRVPIERRWRRPRARPSSPVARAAAQVPPVVSAPSQAVLQDRFWHNHYHLEPYYVRGRSYDQYRPAFELGWLAAERYPGDFASVRPLLERQWASQHGTSLLEWRQVEAAVHAAWERMREAEAAPEPPGPQVQALVQGLQRLNLQTAQHLENLMAQAPQGLMQQVLKRHRQECVAASAELARVCPVPVPASGESAWGGSLQRGWNTLRATWGGAARTLCWIPANRPKRCSCSLTAPRCARACQSRCAPRFSVRRCACSVPWMPCNGCVPACRSEEVACRSLPSALKLAQ